MSTTINKEAAASAAPVTETLDKLQASAEEGRSAVTAALKRAADEADAMARRGIDQARRASETVRDKAGQVSERTVSYIQDEPVKAVLIAAAVGALAAALIGWAARSNSDR